MTISKKTLDRLKQFATDGDSCATGVLHILERLEVLEALLPAPEAAPVATDEELLAMRSWSSHGPTFDSDLVEFGRACYDLGRQHGAAQPLAAPPAQPAAPAGGLVEKLAADLQSRQFGPGDLDRAATLLQQLSAPDPVVVPIPVSERLPGEGDCDAEGKCWLYSQITEIWHCWRLSKQSLWTHWLPYHAIPLPQSGKVQP